MRNSLLSRALIIGSIAAGFSLLSGCNVGPKYVRPNVTAPAVYRGPDNSQVSSDSKDSFGDQEWMNVYREPELQDLIRKALADNYDVRIAAKRILEQQAQVRITRSQEFPLVNIGGTGIGATLPNSLGTQLPNPLVAGSFSLSGPYDATRYCSASVPSFLFAGSGEFASFSDAFE